MTPREALDKFGFLYRKMAGASGGGCTQYVHLYKQCGALREEPDRIEDEAKIPLRASVCGRCENRWDRTERRPE